MADRLPWITFAAIDFLAQNLRPDMKVFEWGIGGSTLFLLPRVAELVSVEHDRAWGESAQQKITEMGLGAGNWNFSLVTPSPDGITTGRDPANADDYISSEAKFQGQNFKDYVTAIDRYADGYFDIILIDGRARPSCFKHAIEKVKVGGYVLWDNTDRIHYDQTMQAVDPAYQFIDLPGPSPYVPFFTRTSVWQRR
ncbi:hypothetical protein [Thalassoporum mexicanum]|uniref:hypothetical protein n=1 Tax=Thalassoporum mexicanum TaxID=3457544 RepID=UPI0002EFDBFD|nr:hypothetical protein [Pseudanabaena sp. PCC 7367]